MSVSERIAMLNKKVNEPKEKLSQVFNKASSKIISNQTILKEKEKDDKKEDKKEVKKVLQINEPEIIRQISKPDNFKDELAEIIHKRNYTCISLPPNGKGLFSNRNDKDSSSIVGSIIRNVDKDNIDHVRKGLEGRFAKSVIKNNDISSSNISNDNESSDVNSNISIVNKHKGVSTVTKKKILKREF